MVAGVDIVTMVLQARRPADLFGAADADHARQLYRRLARNVHPDRHSEATRERASLAFANLERLWRELSGTGPAPAASVITTKRNSYVLGRRIAEGDVANLYRVEYGDQVGVLKMARSPRDADLISAEVSALKRLREVPEEHRFFHPQLADAFRHRDATKRVDRSALVVNYLDDFYSLREVREAYPRGVDARDAAWMLRRLLVAAGTAHDQGLVHGAVVPDHVMIGPAVHGLVLVDWTCSVEAGGSLRAIASDHRTLYPREALDKRPVDYRLDVAMAARCMEFILRGRDQPRPITAFLRGMQVSSPPPAGEVLEEFNELLERLYGARRFRPFHMPPREDA